MRYLRSGLKKAGGSEMSDSTLENVATLFGVALLVLTLLFGAEALYHLAHWIRDRVRWVKWFNLN